MKEEKVTKISYNEDGRISREEVFLNGELFETVDRAYCKYPNTDLLSISSRITTNFKTGSIESQLCKFKDGLITETISSTNEDDIIHSEHVENTYDEHENLTLSIFIKDNTLSSIYTYEYEDGEDPDNFTGSFREYEDGICKRYIDIENTTIHNSDGTSKQTILNKNHYTKEELERTIIKYDTYGSSIYSKYEDFVNDISTVITSLNSSVENAVLIYSFDTIDKSGEDLKYELTEYVYNEDNKLVEIKVTTTDDNTDKEVRKIFSITKNKED